jgi:hypothetical protein
MDAGDIAEPTRLERQFDFVEQNSQCVLLGTNGQTVNELGEEVRTISHPTTSSRLIRSKLLTGNFIPNSAVMIRRSALAGLLFEERYKHAEDYAAWLKLTHRRRPQMPFVDQTLTSFTSTSAHGRAFPRV